MNSIRLYLASSTSPTDEIVNALKTASKRLLDENSILQTRPGDRPEKGDSNQYAWVMPLEIYDEEDATLLHFRQRLDVLADQGILQVRFFRGVPRFRPNQRREDSS